MLLGGAVNEGNSRIVTVKCKHSENEIACSKAIIKETIGA